jgi:holliday junction DNA helicase RuvB
MAEHEIPEVAVTAPRYVTCACAHCGGNIEFDASDFAKDETRTAECPHCHKETVISVPPSTILSWARNGMLPTFGLDPETTPRYLRDVVGQDRIKGKIQHAIEASRANGLALGHIILVGPAGSGKTTLALLAADNIAYAMSQTVRAVNGSAIKYAGDLAGMLTNLEDGDLLFVDNIDLLPKTISEYLEPALADFKMDITIDQGPNARSVRLNLPVFTLIATATNKKRLSPMLQACFTTDEELEGYSTAELADITRHDAKCLMLEIDQDATDLIVRSTGGTPSSVWNLIRHIRVYAKIKKSSQRITAEIATEALKLLESNERLEESKQARHGIPPDVRREVWRRDGGKCVKCGSRERLEYDHIIPVTRGGSNTARNIELLCETCNRAKSDLIQ